MGQDDDGPFYTMPFVAGRTLEEAIRQFHQDESLRRHPGRRSIEFRGLLQRFIAVCETMAYAHDQGVVHRDLKPSNIMLGPYGETLVMDWGLARRGLGDPADSGPEDDPPSPSPSPDHLTATGAVLGTPRYMSPEQAAGSRAGPASDIYSLGVILAAILAGEVPEEAATGGNEPRQRAPRCRRDGEARVCRRPPWAVCQKAMAALPEQRYESPCSLAEDLTRWLADEPVTAYREPAMARLRRWVRRHRGWSRQSRRRR